ncbi:MAG: amidophosphoribosyltransferase [Betaproteobacteria bacterium TMED156]|nr:MAG: amidophosphoribosyltransferase [Betaproteobacteria bacterium TMED156]
MCAVFGIVGSDSVNQKIYDALLLMQHRGQDATGIVTASEKKISMCRGVGLVRDVFRTRDMRNLTGEMGIGHCRYPTAGNAGNPEEVQPFYVNAPFGIVLGHNGNLTNAHFLQDEMYQIDRRHINTDSDSEVLLNVFANELQKEISGTKIDSNSVFCATESLYKRVEGAYACVAMISGFGVVGFRDPFGIRPLVIGKKKSKNREEWAIASESVALQGLGFDLVRDVKPGECVVITKNGQIKTKICANQTSINPCVFEFVYFARPDSLIDGVSVYDARLKMGQALSEKVKDFCSKGNIDVVIPVPDSSRPAALELALSLGIPYREGFIKNRYIGRTFIMPGQETRRRSVRQKLNAIGSEFYNKNVLIVDDSIVRGTTSREIIQMARDAGASKVSFASASPPVRFPNVYGIDMPTKRELIAHGRSEEEICRAIGADHLFFQELNTMRSTILDFNRKLDGLEASCFDGKYITKNLLIDSKIK